MADLLPCPFCGGIATLEEVTSDHGPDDIRFSIGCNDGETTGFHCFGYQSLSTYPRRSDAVEAWNRRATSNPGTKP